MKTIGILGGMGPLATVKLFEKIVLFTDAKNDQEHIHTIIDSNTNIADRTDYILGGDKDPTEELRKSAKRLEGAGADFLIMPCNTAHFFYDEIIKSIDIPFLHMIEETAKEIKANYDFKDIGLLATFGTYKSKVYDKIFNKHGLNIVNPKEEDKKHVMDLIYNIKKGIYEENLDDFYKTMENMSNQGVKLFILGCTELSVAVDLYQLKGNFIDPMDAVAKAAIINAGGKYKEKTS